MTKNIIFVITCFHLLETITHAQTCNLLESGGDSYYDYSGYNSIETLCSSNADDLSLWEQYQCEGINNRNETCWPRRYLSQCSPGELKGIVMYYHGFSACPDQWWPLVDTFTANCYHFYTPTTVGHGYNYCNPNSTDIDQCLKGTLTYYNLTLMPNTRSGYLNFVNEMNVIMADEIEIVKACELEADSSYDSDSMESIVGGLSLGGSLSTNTLYTSYDNGMKWTKQVLLSPFLGLSSSTPDTLVYKCSLSASDWQACMEYYFDGFGISDGDLISFGNNSDINSAFDTIGDFMANLTYTVLGAFIETELIDNSYETLNLLVRDLVTYLIETDDEFVTENEWLQEALETGYSWGESCENDQQNGNRGGFCDYTVRHISAGHSLGSYILENVGNSSDISETLVVDTQFLFVERDGTTRNSLGAQYAQLLFDYNETAMNERVEACDWLISEECQESSYNDDSIGDNNDCGVPHSSVSNHDNLLESPYFLYWNQTYHDGLVRFMINGEYDIENFMVEEWDGSRDQCFVVSLYDPPEVLFADVPVRVEVLVNIIEDAISDAIKEEIIDGISEYTGAPRGVIELTFKIVGYASDDELDDLFDSLDIDTDLIDLFENIFDTSDSKFAYLRFYVPSDEADVLESLINLNAFPSFDSFAIDFARIKGVDDVNEASTSVIETVKEEADEFLGLNTSVGVTLLICVALVLIVFALSGCLCFRVKKTSEAKIEELKQKRKSGGNNNNNNDVEMQKVGDGNGDHLVVDGGNDTKQTTQPPMKLKKSEDGVGPYQSIQM